MKHVNKVSEMQMHSPAIGIDLGTINTCVAVIKNNRVDVIANERGFRTTPSVVCFSDEDILVGDDAKSIAHLHPTNCIFELKRIMGSRYSDKTTQDEISKWPFKVVEKNGRPAIEIEENGTTKEYYPEEIISIILEHVKTTAETYLGRPVLNAVITVPAYFNNSQRSATKTAAELAGLRVLRIINEPTAAAIGYGSQNKSDSPRTVLIYDLGGGTFDVSIVKIDQNNYEVKATSGDTHLGGCDFDNNLIEYIVEKFATEYGTDLRQNKTAMSRLRIQCETAKKDLSFQSRAHVELFVISLSKDIDVEITRKQFENLNRDLFLKTLDAVKTCMVDAEVTKDEITEVVLVGGSTRIPKVQELLREYFNNRDLVKTINPDEAVAYGAAIHANDLGRMCSMPEELRGVKLVDVTSLSLGMKEGGDGKMAVFIRRNTPLPCKVTKIFYTGYDNQTVVRHDIYEGERRLADDNNFLGTFEIDNLPQRPAGQVSFVDTFSVDENGILRVDCLVEGTDIRRSIDINLTENRLSKEEIEGHIKETQQEDDQGAEHINCIKAIDDLCKYCEETLARATLNVGFLGEVKISIIKHACTEAKHQLNDSEDDKLAKTLLLEVKSICEPLLGLTIFS